MAAGGSTVAELAGKYGDGISTSAGSLREHGDKILKSFFRGAQLAHRDPETMVRGVLITTSYDEDINRAIKSARY